MKARKEVKCLEDGGNDRLNEDGGVGLTKLVGMVVGFGAPASLEVEGGIGDAIHGPVA